MHKKDRDYYLAAVLKKNPLFISEPVYADELDAKAEKILEQYSIGHLIIAGDNRYLSGDLLDSLTLLLSSNIDISKRQHTFWVQAITNRFPETAFFAPGAAYPIDETGTLLRNPHIAKNEELQLIPYTEKNNMRKYYLGHLTDVVMVDAFMLASERLGDTDYDGDMIKTISDPLLSKCGGWFYRHVNHQPDTDWVVPPMVNFDAYFGTARLGKKYLSLIPPGDP